MTLIAEYSEKLDMCPECNGNIISIKEKGDIVCYQCGLIIYEKQFDLSHNDRRIYNKEDRNKKERLGTPISPLIPDIILCTYIDKNSINNSELKRAVRRDSRLTWMSRNLSIASKELKRIGHNLNLPRFILEEAFFLYKKAFKTKMLKGRSIIGMITACIYYSCKNRSIPRTFHEILSETPISEKIVKKCDNSLVRELNLKVLNTNPMSYVSRFAVELNLGFDIEIIARKILIPMKKKIFFAVKIRKVFVQELYILLARSKT